MNQIPGFALAAHAVPTPRLKPAVTMTSKLWSMYACRSFAYSDASLGTVYGGFAALMAAAPFVAPRYVYSLKFLSFTVPTSVTTPILYCDGSVGSLWSLPAVNAAHG